MKTHTIILTIILLVLVNDSMKAQIPSVTIKDLLKSKTWILNKVSKATMRITDTEIIYYIDNEFFGSEKYHLSDLNCVEASFDSSKVGIITTGKYIFYEKSGCDYVKFINSLEFKTGHYYSPTKSEWTIITAKPE